MKAYKVFTHDLRSPVRGGAPVWDGSLPHRLPPVAVDTSWQECGAGWSACRTPEDALRVAGMWPNGRPSRVFEVESVAGRLVVERTDKLRTETWDVMRELHEGEVGQAVLRFSRRHLGEHAAEMTIEQMEWRSALRRTLHDSAEVERQLRAALKARGLGWRLRRFDSACAARAAWDARDAMDAWAARDARAAWAARAARAAWDAWDSRDSRPARDAWDAWDALVTQIAARLHLVDCSPDRHTTGIREAYRHGLAIALPTGPNELGWAMEGV